MTALKRLSRWMLFAGIVASLALFILALTRLGCKVEETVTQIVPYKGVNKAQIAQGIRRIYETRFRELDSNSQAHFAVRIFRMTGETTDLRAVAIDIGRWIYDLKSHLSNLHIEGYIEQQSKAMHHQKRDVSRVLRLRKEMFESRKEMLFHRRILYIAQKLRDYGLHGGRFRDSYEAARKHLLNVDFAGFILDPEVIRTYGAQTSNLVFWLKRIDVIDLEKEYTQTYQDVFMKSADNQINSADYQNKLYGLTHFIIGDSHYYQRIVSAEKHAWILEYFDRHIIEILSWSKPDIIAEIALCYRLCGKHNHRVVRMAEEYLSRAYDPVLGYIPSETGNIDFNMAEHRNAVAYMVLSGWDKLHKGPYLDEAAVLAFIPVEINPSVSASSLPIGGEPVPELKAFDWVMAKYMEINEINAGLLSVMKDGQIMLQRAYGWMDQEQRKPLEQDAIMRIASVTKPFTAACIRRMVEKQQISLSDFAFDLGQASGGLLRIDPYPKLADERLKKITVRHLLEHTAGWDAKIAGDFTFRELEVADAMGLPLPPSRQDIARWILAQPLQYAPGEQKAYSNEGYFFLGLIIEEYGNRDYIGYLLSEVLAPAAIKPSTIMLGRTLQSNSYQNEPWYESRGICKSVIETGLEVECAYGGWSLENHIGAGGLVASPQALLRFLETYYVIGDRIGLPRKSGDSGAWSLSHTGGLPGTSSLARQRGDGIHYAVIFNKSAPSPGDYAVGIRMLIDKVIEKEVDVWPKQP